MSDMNRKMFKMNNKALKFLDKRLMSLAFTIGLTIPTFAQDGNSSVNTSDEIASALISTEKPISAIAKVEEITKEQKEKEASIKHQHASELHKAKNYAAAINSYVKSIELYSQVSATHPRIVEKVASMRIDLAKVYKEYAEILIQDGQSSADIMKLEQAEMFLEKSQKNDKRLELYVFNRKETLRSLKKQAEFINAANPQGANKRAEELLVEKKWRYDQAQLMITNKRYMDAKELLSESLAMDPFDTRSAVLIKKVNKLLRKAGHKRRVATMIQKIAEVEWKWTLPIQNSVVNTSSTSVDLGKVPISSERNIIVQKLKTVIPRFKQEQKSIVEVIDGIREICRSKNSEEYGINIIYKSFNELKVTQDNTDTDVDEFATSVVDDAGDSMGKTYDFDFENMPIGEIIRYICLSSGVKYKIEEHAVVIADPRVAIDEVVTRFYPVSSNVFASIAETGATGGDDDLGGLDEGDSEAVSVKNYLEGTGVKFAAGAKVKYLEGISRLIFTNNITEHRRLQKILDQLQVDAAQIIVEAKFVEVQQANLDELGFQWTLEGHSSLAELGERRVGFRSVESADEIDAPLLAANQDPTAFRAGQGVRSLNKLAIDAPEDGLLAFNTVIDSFKFKTIMRALAQQENTDVLSAPKVLSENGSTAILRVVEERYFPESWEKPEIKVRGTTINTTTSPAGNLTTTRQRLEIQPSVPELGDARDIGVILEVTPTVDADGITIDLELKPEVVEFIRYDDAYNNEIIIFPRGDEVLFDTPILPALTQIAVLREAADLITWVGEESNVTAFFAGVADTVLFYQEEPELRIESRYDMPVISTRSVETRVKIWDGESVVIGGLMKEQVVTVNDRIPYLADLPLIGGLFENKGERREKNSLMIFVTARLIDRAGLPLRANDVRGLPDFKRL